MQDFHEIAFIRRGIFCVRVSCRVIRQGHEDVFRISAAVPKMNLCKFKHEDVFRISAAVPKMNVGSYEDECMHEDVFRISAAL